MQRFFLLFATLGLLAPFVGCASSSLPTPRARIGALPFPGVTSLYAAADPEHVAPHFYRNRMSRPFEAEGDRGIVYTRRAGFLDIAHVREGMDWTWYVGQRIRNDLQEDNREKEIRTAIRYEDCIMTVRVPSNASNEFIDALAAQTAYRLLTWHEIATWYGYSTVPLVSERRSSFTVDDTSSHVIGALIGHRLLALAPSMSEYERLAGDQLKSTLEHLEALSDSETSAMCRSVEGTWWRGTTPLVVDTNIALEAHGKNPMLITADNGLAVGDALPELPSLSANSTNWYELKPGNDMLHHVRNILAKDMIESDRDLERLVFDVEQGIRHTRTGVVVVNDSNAQSRNVTVHAGSRMKVASNR